MTHISILIKKYYRKEKGKIVFVNGMTLNQLAIDMWERLGHRGMDASVLSRVIKGERNFTFKQLQVFCDILEMGEKERRKLERALSRDILKRHAVKVLPTRIPLVLERLEEQSASAQNKKPFYQQFPYVILAWYGIVLIWWMKLQFNLDKAEVDVWGIFQNFIPLIAGIYGLRLAFKKFGGWKNDFGRAIIFFSAGLLGAWFGMETWVFYNIFLKIQVPYPSWADVGFFSLIPFYTLGVFYFARTCRVKLTLSTIDL